MKISRVSEMRDLDRRAIEEFGITQALLMENAGQAAYFTILNELGIQGRDFVIFCGIGNNGGDGLVVARKIHSSGGRVTVFILGDRSKFKGAAKQNLEIVQKLNIDLMDLDDIVSVTERIQRSDAIIDAIFGTGLVREVTGIYRDVIEMINSSGKTVFSIDIPSGVHGNTGQAMGTAVKADYTITFGLPKIGNLLYPGFEMGGRLYVTHISFPPVIQHADELKINTNDPAPLPARNQDAHKGNCGKALFIAGSSNYLGAPYFAALSFLKAGGGLAYLATPETVSAFIGNKGSEIVFVPQKSTETGSIGRDNKQQLLQFSENVDMVVMGPGLSLHPETQMLVRELSAEIKKPLLLDGDGITALAGEWTSIKRRKYPTILTPHMGEMTRITGQKMDALLANKIDVLQSTSHELNATIALKGAHTLIGYSDQRVFMNLSGNPGMATAGSGDVLTGAIAAMFGLGFLIHDAVRMGVFVHGLAGDLAAQEKGEDGLIAGDIMDHLPPAMKMYREAFHSVVKDFYHSIYVT
jgi:NAD(P)H-hydrate epimerase